MENLRTGLKLKHSRWIILATVAFLSTLTYAGEYDAFEITELIVPPFVEQGEDVNLTCRYDTKTDLYKIAWLCNGSEFYVYNFIEGKTKTDYPKYSDGKFQLDLNASNDTQVVLRNVTIDASDMYQCKITGRMPEAHVKDKEDFMQVGVIPEEKPTISGANQNEHRSGDPILLNCTSAPSIPAANLAWRINEREAPTNSLKKYSEKITSDNLVVTTLGLKYVLKKSDFKGHEVKFNCTAHIYQKSHLHSHVNIPGSAKDTTISSSDANRNFLWTGAFSLFLVAELIIR